MRHIRKTKRSGLPRTLIVAMMIIAVTLGSVVTAVANSVDITVYDGEDTYSFSMIGADAESILARAETEGMEPVSTIDECVFSESSTVLTIKRNVRVAVKADGGLQSMVVPEGSVLADVLADNGITVHENDVIEPALDTMLYTDTQVELLRSNRVTVCADGESITVEQLEGTVADALKTAGVEIDVTDEITPAEDTPLEDGMRIMVGRQMLLTIAADGEEKVEYVVAHDVEEALAEAEIALGEDDRVYFVSDAGEILAERTSAIEEGTALRVERITKENVTVSETIAHDTVYQEVEGRYKDQQTVVTRGTDGEKQVTYEVTYADGVEIGREAVAEEVTAEPVDEVIERGTEVRADAIGNGTFVDSTGTTVGYERVITGQCTAYSWEAGSVTSTGESVQYGYVAVDPRIIPYGSLLYITSPDGEWNYGYCYAMDTGSAARSGRIVADLFYDSEDVCNAFGRRNMTVYVIQEGGYHGW